MNQPPSAVIDFTSNAPEVLEYYAKELRSSDQRKSLFEAIYKGKRRVRKVADLAATIGLSEKRVLELGKRLAVNGMIVQRKMEGRVAYEQVPRIQHIKRRVLLLASSSNALGRLTTKRRVNVRISPQAKSSARRNCARLLTIDDIDSFAAVRDLKGKKLSKLSPERLSEETFKCGMQNIIGEKTSFKDWGGESNDFFSTRLRVNSKRVYAAFALKGPGKSGILTPGKMGKNGDQIQRLFEAPAVVFGIQYEGTVAQSVYSQMDKLAREKCRSEEKNISYIVIDGADSQRLRVAYRKEFAAASLNASKR